MQQSCHLCCICLQIDNLNGDCQERRGSTLIPGPSSGQHSWHLHRFSCSSVCCTNKPPPFPWAQEHRLLLASKNSGFIIGVLPFKYIFGPDFELVCQHLSPTKSLSLPVLSPVLLLLVTLLMNLTSRGQSGQYEARQLWFVRLYLAGLLVNRPVFPLPYAINVALRHTLQWSESSVSCWQFQLQTTQKDLL